MTDTQITDAATADSGTARTRRRAPGLEGMVLAELQQVAGGLGIRGTGRMRKGALVDAIRTAQSGGSSAGGARDGAASSSTATSAAPATDVAPVADREAAAPAADRAASTGSAATDSAPEETRAREGRGRSRNRSGRGEDGAPQDAPSRGGREDNRDDTRDGGREQGGRNRDSGRDGRDGSGNQNGGRDNGNRDGGRDNGNRDGGRDNGNRDGGSNRDGNRNNGGNRDNNRDSNRDNNRQRDRQDGPDGDDDERGGRRRRRRDRRGNRERPTGNRDRGANRNDDPQVHDDDVLMLVAGIVDILDNYAFVRTSGYLPGPGDVYISMAMVRRSGLRKGDAVTGAVRQPREGEKQQKFNALVRVDTVNGASVEVAKARPEFSKLTPLYPQDRLRLETEPGVSATRIIDLVAPIGKGQRGLIVSPPKAGKTLILQAIANAVTTNNPETHLMVVLVDERPEEVTDMERTVKGEVIASTFDRPAEDHTTIAELAIERAKRLVELGQDVVVLLDSITRLGRAYNLAAPASGRILSGGVDSSALYPPKRFFGAARNIENGGSLTILATALVETGSKMDEVIFEEFKGTGNMELRLRRDLADKRIFPAIDVDASGTRREEILVGREELAIMWQLRRVLSGLEAQQRVELLLDRLKGTGSNAEFMMTVQKTTPAGKAASGAKSVPE